MLTSDEKPYAIEFRNGRYFVSLAADQSGPAEQAMRFATEGEADRFMSKHDWMLFHGGMVVRLDGGSNG